MTLKAAVSPAESLTNFRSRVNLPEASTSPVEVLRSDVEGVGRGSEEVAAVDEVGRLLVSAVVQVQGHVVEPDFG